MFSERDARGWRSPASGTIRESKRRQRLVYARAFRKVGPVDIACIQYRFRANELEEVLFVNGDPAMIDVDSQKFVSQSNFQFTPRWRRSIRRSAFSPAIAILRTNRW